MMYTNFYKKKKIKKNNIKKKNFHGMDQLGPDSILELISLREYHKFALVKLTIKTGLPLMSQPNINAVVGPYGINIMNLQKKLEPLDEVFEQGTLIPILLKVYDFDKYHLMVKSPSLNFFLNSIGTDSNFYSIYQVYELVKKKKKDLNLLHLPNQAVYSSIISYLKSGNKGIYR